MESQSHSSGAETRLSCSEETDNVAAPGDDGAVSPSGETPPPTEGTIVRNQVNVVHFPSPVLSNKDNEEALTAAVQEHAHDYEHANVAPLPPAVSSEECGTPLGSSSDNANQSTEQDRSQSTEGDSARPVHLENQRGAELACDYVPSTDSTTPITPTAGKRKGKTGPISLAAQQRRAAAESKRRHIKAQKTIRMINALTEQLAALVESNLISYAEVTTPEPNPPVVGEKKGRKKKQASSSCSVADGPIPTSNES